MAQNYQIKITLQGSKPPIWRRALVPAKMNLQEFHAVLQIVMGWENYHLHQFVCNGKSYGVIDDDPLFADQTVDESNYQLRDLLTNEKDELIYEYDFGDGWQHLVLLEKISTVDIGLQVPICQKGKGACPPEDCGGIWGYQELLQVLKDPQNPDYQNMITWLGGSFDPTRFDVKEVNSNIEEHYRS